MTSSTPNQKHNTHIKRWSFSGLSLYEKCPLAAKKKYIDRVPGKEPSEQLLRGLKLHKAAEDFITAKTDEIDDGIGLFTTHLQHLREGHAQGTVLVEENWGYDIAWNPVDFDDETCWTRGSLDVLEHISDTEVCGEDWKSGKRYPPKHIQQEQLYVVYAMQRLPHITDMRFRFRYFDEHGDPESCSTSRRYNRGHVERLKAGFHARGIRMTTDTTFRPHPSPINCKWCDYKESCEWATV